MKKGKISLLALTMATTVVLTACTGARVAKRNEGAPETTIESGIVVDTVEETTMEEVNQIKSSNMAFSTLLDEYYKSGKTVNDILTSEDKNSVLYSL